MTDNVRVEFVGMEPTDALREYATDKMSKHERLLKPMTSMQIFLKDNIYSKGVKADFSVEVNAKLPKITIHVKEVGEDMYALIDSASDTLFRRLKRYTDKLKQWEGEGSWKVMEAKEAEQALAQSSTEEEADDYSTYVPKVVERITAEYMSPIDEAEAIEKMELGGVTEYLFKRKDGRWCMVHTLGNGTYGIVEQGNDKI